MKATRRAAAVTALTLAAVLAGCSEDAQDAVPGGVEDVAPGTREEGTPDEPIGDEDEIGELEVPLEEEPTD